MNPKRIFISSVQKEFSEERAALRDWPRNDALMRRFFEPFLFEDVPAADRRADEVYLDGFVTTIWRKTNGESHYFLGRRYRLRVHEEVAPARVVVRGVTRLDLFVRPGTSSEHREAILLRWHREQIKKLIPPLLEKWQLVLDVEVADWGIRKMKTKWGSCNTDARRVWFNLELAKKPVQCLEYIVVHELVHLLERHHNERFTALLDGLMPQWRQFRKLLNSAPLGHESWGY